jgi:glycosyltransferase involved in cell wall biosynthesis
MLVHSHNNTDTDDALKELTPKPLSPGAQQGHILYITFDGLLEPLGRSQVLSYLLRLSEQGFRYTLISLERERDLSDAALVEGLERELTEHHIRWVRLPYLTGGARAVFRNCRAAFRAARREFKRSPVWIVHARSYVATLVGWMLRRMYGTPYIFDMRGYWIDELADEGRWVTNQIAYKIGKKFERKLLEDASAVVTLTELQADDLRAGLLKKFPRRPIEVITTCADYEEFDRSKPDRGVVPDAIRERLRGKLVIGMVGSINASYRVDESFLLFKYLWEARPDAHLLCLTRQTAEMEAVLRKHSIPESAYTLTTARHQDMADWMKHIDWAILLLNARYSKRGSMPTKLAEFFAAGVRPIQYGCNEEVSRKVQESGLGLVLEGVTTEDLRRAAAAVAATPLSNEQAARAREATSSHFSLEAGVRKYQSLLTKLHLEGKA